jgi:hypothetical protein
VERVKKARESAAIRIGPNRPRESQPHSSAPHLGKRKRPNVTTRDEHAPEAKSLRARYPKHWPARKVEVRGGVSSVSLAWVTSPTGLPAVRRG